MDVVKKGIDFARSGDYKTIIVDTAGRLQIDSDMMAELQKIKSEVEPTDAILVVDAMTGQESANLVKTFDDEIGLTGAILSKADGDSRGGAALSMKAVTGKPIKFVSNGEKMDDIEAFYPERMASRILGMGDVLTLVEKAEDALPDVDHGLVPAQPVLTDVKVREDAKVALLQLPDGCSHLLCCICF